MRIVAEGNTHWGAGFPDHWFHWDNWPNDYERTTERMLKFIAFADATIPRFEQLEEIRSSEHNVKWRGNFDIAYARLLKARVRADEFLWALEDFRRNPRLLKKNPQTVEDYEKKLPNGWHIVYDTKLKTGGPPGKLAEKTKSPPAPRTLKPINGSWNAENLKRNEELLERSMGIFARVMAEHEMTPWFYVAKAEKRKNVGIKEWKEGFDGRHLPEELRKKRSSVKPPKL